jgi:hypothetical protein
MPVAKLNLCATSREATRMLRRDFRGYQGPGVGCVHDDPDRDKVIVVSFSEDDCSSSEEDFSSVAAPRLVTQIDFSGI